MHRPIKMRLKNLTILQPPFIETSLNFPKSKDMLLNIPTIKK